MASPTIRPGVPRVGLRGATGAALLTAASVLDALAQPAGTDLEEVLRLNSEARGGRAAVERIFALRLQLRIEEPAFTVSATYVATRDGYMRIDVFDTGERVFSEALGPAGGWQWRGDAVSAESLSPEGAAALRRGVLGNLYALYEWPSKDIKLRLTDGAGLCAAGSWQLSATYPGAFRQTLCIDRQTHRTTRTAERSALHPDIDGRAVQHYTDVEERMTLRGVSFPRVMVRRAAGSDDVMQRTTITGAEAARVDEPRPSWARADYFRAPGAGR